MSQAISLANATPRDISTRIAQAKPAIIRSLPANLQENAERFARSAELALIQSDDLRRCSEQSILLSIYRACQLGLEVNSPSGHAYLIPYKGQCTLQVGYKGLIELAFRSKRFLSIDGRAVYQGDEFDYWFDFQPNLSHRPGNGPRTDDMITHVYATAILANGTKVLEVMDKATVDKIRNSSMGRNAGPWTYWYDQMAIGRVIKRLLKRLPLSDDIAVAMEIDNAEDQSKITDEQTPQLKGSASLAARITARNNPPASGGNNAPAPAPEPQGAISGHTEGVEPGDDYADVYPGEED